MTTGIIIAIVLILLSYAKWYRVDSLDVIYKGRDGILRTVNITYTHGSGAWLHLSEVKKCIAETYGEAEVEVICMQTKTVGWQINK